MKFLLNKPHKINDHFYDILNNFKTNRKKSKALTRLIPLVLEHEKIITFTKENDLNLIELLNGIWNSFGLNYADFVFNYSEYKTNISPLLQIYETLDRFYCSKEKYHHDMVILSIILDKDLVFSPSQFPPHSIFSIALTFFSQRLYR